MMDQRSPLLQFPGGLSASVSGGYDHHAQFCHLVGVRPVDHPHNEAHKPPPQSLYARALKHRRRSTCTYALTASLVNTLLLVQIVLGAALTGLGASNSSRVLITVFGALNTIIAGVVAFLKSRGQPLRARMFRDDLDRVVDEIENSAIMWYGIATAAHGYDAIDTDDQVTVRSEVARLTRLYDKAVKTNTMNDPDMYSAGTHDPYSASLRKAQAVPAADAPAAVPPVIPPEPAPASTTVPVPVPAALPPPPVTQEANPPAAVPDADESPASKAPEPELKPVDSTPKAEPPDKAAPAGVDTEVTVSSSTPALAPGTLTVTAHDPDASPASAARPPKKEDSQKSDKTLVESSKSSLGQ
jgi:hypothetical protein